MAIRPMVSSSAAPKLVGPTWAVDNPEYYAKRKDARCKTGPNAALLQERSIDKRKSKKQRLVAAAEFGYLEDELSDDGFQSDDPMEYEEDAQETYCQIDSRIRVKPEFMTALELNSTTITSFLKPFKSQLTNFFLSNLAEFDELKPYITTPNKKSAENDTSSDESFVFDDDIPPSQRRRRAVMNPKVFYYPLTEQQIYVLNRFRQADTLIFTSLPSQDCIIRLIALSVLVSQPFYNQVLFPNVEKVVYSSAMQEKSLVDRYAYLGSTFDPHPITFALDWLVYDFSLCIHSASSTFRSQWIDSEE